MEVELVQSMLRMARVLERITKHIEYECRFSGASDDANEFEVWRSEVRDISSDLYNAAERYNVREESSNESQ